MNAYVAVTDGDWFRFLRSLKPEEVNFWRPSGKQGFRALVPGEPFLFKLHFPYNFIVGGGFFESFSIQPASLRLYVNRALFTAKGSGEYIALKLLMCLPEILLPK